MAFYMLGRGDNRKIEFGIDYVETTLLIRAFVVKGSSSKKLNYSIDRLLNNVDVRFKFGENKGLVIERAMNDLRSEALFMREVTDPKELDGETGIFPPGNFNSMKFEWV